MNAEKLIDRLERLKSELEINHATQVMGELVKLYPKIKEVQPHLTDFHMGMGVYGFSGKLVVEYEDYEDNNITDEIIGQSEDDLIIYKTIINEASNFAEQLNDMLDDNFGYVFGVENHVNKECFEFIKLCNYLVETRSTTLYDGVNEDGVIIHYGRNGRFDTYIEALEYGKVEYLEKYKIPYVFYDGDKKEYHDKITI